MADSSGGETFLTLSWAQETTGYTAAYICFALKGFSLPHSHSYTHTHTHWQPPLSLPSLPCCGNTYTLLSLCTCRHHDSLQHPAPDHRQRHTTHRATHAYTAAAGTQRRKATEQLRTQGAKLGACKCSWAGGGDTHMGPTFRVWHCTCG